MSAKQTKMSATKIGLYFGTFNPIHIGHLVIANHFAEFTALDEVWFIVTPHNPFKEKKSLLEDHHRYEMVYRATESYPKLKPSRIEFKLPQPNYTVNTLAHLEEKYPEKEFILIMGEDNLTHLHKWKNHEFLTENFEIYVYPRVAGSSPKAALSRHPKVTRIEAPIMQISSSFIRQSIKDDKNITPLLPPKVWPYLDEMNFYR